MWRRRDPYLVLLCELLFWFFSIALVLFMFGYLCRVHEGHPPVRAPGLYLERW